MRTLIRSLVCLAALVCADSASAQTYPNKPIRIIVKNGHVNLEGVVDSEGDKTLAGIQASGVPEVFSVTNNLQISR